MAIDYVALSAELSGDPATLGYATPIGAKNDQAVADILNLPRAGAGFTANREGITASLFFSNVDPTEYAALTQVQLLRLQTVLLSAPIDLNDVSIQATLLGIFPNPGTTRTNLQALLKRQGSRGEKLFGHGTVITASDVSRALRGL